MPKPLHWFGKGEGCADGYQNICRTCVDELYVRPLRKRRRAARDAARMWTCQRCRAKVPGQCPRDTSRRCPSCVKKYVQKQSARIAFKSEHGKPWSGTAEYKRIRRHAYPETEGRGNGTRRLRMIEQSDGTITPQAVGNLFKTAELCPYCWCMLTNNKSLDHRVPLARGGAHSISNVVVCCRSCNSKKGRMPFDRWLEKVKNGR